MKTYPVCIALLLVSAYTASANLLQNPGFEVPEATMDFAGSSWTDGGPGGPGREFWAARSGSTTTNKGGFMPGSVGPDNGFLYQDVAVSTGTHTFSIWVRNEAGYVARTNEVSIEWYDADTNLLQRDSSVWLGLVSDDAWHQLYVSATCTSQDLSFARARYFADYDTPGIGNQASFFDDAAFYAGRHQPAMLENGSFEPSPLASVDWRVSKWYRVPDDESKSTLADWAARSGARGLGFKGWEEAADTNRVAVYQNMVPGTGTYSLAVYLERETNFSLSNVQVRLEWYDRSFTNPVCEASVTNVVVANDYNWYEFSVAGTCASAELYEVRACLSVEWLKNTNDVPDRGFRLDDARFLPGIYDGSSVTKDWSYHSATDATASVEWVPGTNVGAFLQVDYTAKTSTFYVLTPAEGFARYEGEGEEVGLRFSFFRPEDGSFVDSFDVMTWAGQVEVDAAAPFHGQPLAGTQTQNLWCLQKEFPRDTNGVIYVTNAINIFYAPYLRTTNEVGGETDRMYLVNEDPECTNNLGQFLHPSPVARDYAFVLNPPFNAEFQDPGFEIPADSADFTNSPWFGFGDVARETWARRSGQRGVRYGSWDPGSGGVFQDVQAVDTQYTASIWVKRMPGANIDIMEFKIEWFNSAAQVFFAETNAFVLPADDRWHRHCITSTLPPGQEALFVRPVFFASFSDGSFDFHESTLFDDAELYAGGFTGVQPLANGGFEIGSTNGGFEGAYWDGVFSDWVGRDTWAARSDTWGGNFKGFDTSQETYDATLSQALNLSTGVYVFSAWIKAEDAIALTNFEMRIEWLRKDLTDAQAPTVEPITLPLDNAWHAYTMTGACSAADLFEVRPMFRAGWDKNEGPGNKAVMVDDVTFHVLGFLEDSDGDGMPDWWEELYFGGPTNAHAEGNGDTDAALNIEEYIADTNPTNGDSWFNNLITNLFGMGTTVLQVGPPTTNSRVYDVWWKTNLLESGPWTPMGYDLPGDASGAALMLTVTNDVQIRSYITGVKLP